MQVGEASLSTYIGRQGYEEAQQGHEACTSTEARRESSVVTSREPRQDEGQ